MMSICKFSSVSFCYEDGGKSESEVKSSYQRAKMIKEKPSLLEIFSFVFYYPSSLIGPSFEFRDFIKFIRLEEEYADIPYGKCAFVALQDFLLGIASMAYMLVFQKIFDPQYCGTLEFQEKNIFYRYSFMMLARLLMSTKYYTGWKISQASCIFSGLSYDKKENKEKGIIEHKFDKIESCNLYQIEIALNFRHRIQYWNRTVHLWLKYYVYMRIININHKYFKDNNNIASLITFMCSACWHGFYPVYYLFFFNFYLIEQIGAALEVKLNFFEMVYKWPLIYRIIYWNFMSSLLQFVGMSFVLRDIYAYYNFYKAFYFIPIIILILLFIILVFFVKKTKNKEIKGKKEH